MNNNSRRKFLSKTIPLTAVCAGINASQLSPGRVSAGEKDFSRVVYRELGSTGFKVSEVGFGAFGGMSMQTTELIHAVLDSGINYIDTANAYMNGRNEEIIGKVMKTRRKEVFLSTKVRWSKPDEMLGMMETSLKRLNTDYVDCMFLHDTNLPEQALNEDFIKIFDTAKKRGMCRFVGISTHTNQAAIIEAALSTKFWEAVLVGYNYFTAPDVAESIKKARTAGLAVIAMKIFLNPSTWPWTPLADIRKDKNGTITASQALLKWVLENPYVDTTVPGITTFEQLKEDVAVMGIKMSFGERNKLKDFGKMIGDNYCRGTSGCTGCKGKCPKGVDVSQINRCLGYVFGYGDTALGWENYRALPKSSRLDLCADCPECTVECINGLNLSENIKFARKVFC